MPPPRGVRFPRRRGQGRCERSRWSGRDPVGAVDLGLGRRFSLHGLRRTFATLHLARGTPIKWIQVQGEWSSAKRLLDWYGHFLPSEQHGYADSLGTMPDGTQTARRPSFARRLLADRQHTRQRGIAWGPGQDSNLRPVA